MPASRRNSHYLASLRAKRGNPVCISCNDRLVNRDWRLRASDSVMNRIDSLLFN